MEIVSSGIVAVPSGVSSTGLYFIQEGVLQVLNGGWAQDIALAEGGRAVVSSGGIGNDRMHGGGGVDVFTFCENFGTDTVEQPVDGSVLLWFASGSIENWNAETMTYADGKNSVTVLGVSADHVLLEFGDDGSDMFNELVSAGAFDAFTSQRIFEESGRGILAGQ